jgi:hypothetical protein
MSCVKMFARFRPREPLHVLVLFVSELPDDVIIIGHILVVAIL